MKQRNLLLALCSFVIVFSSCEKIIGKGPVVIDNRSTTSFNSLVIGVPADTYFRQDSVLKVEIHAQQNILDEIESVVINNELRIRFRDINTNVRSHDGITIYVSAPDIRNMELEGSGNLQVTGPFTPANIGLSIEGSGNIKVQDISTTIISTNISGSGDISINNGMANEATLTIEGSGHTDVSNVQVKDANARISGSGTIKVFATQNLKARISGSGTIFYKGTPVINSQTSGSGTVVHL
jgi:hypothetical protein